MSTLQERGWKQDRVKDAWTKLCESEARVKFWYDMMMMRAGTRELESIGESIHTKFRSKKMVCGREERCLVEKGVELKWRDEKKYRRDLYGILEREKRIMGEALGLGWKYRKKLKLIKKEVLYHRKKEEERLRKKKEHLQRLRQEAEEEKWNECPDELVLYKDANIFNKEKFKDIKKEEVGIRVVGDITLTEEEKAVLKLNPKFAVMERINSEDIEIEAELGLAKLRYQLMKEDDIIDEVIEEESGEEDVERKKKKRRRLNEEEEELLEKMEIIEAESRQVYDQASKTFDYTKKRTTDLKENAEVRLPQPCDASTESSINVLKNRILDVFRDFKKEKCDERGSQKQNLDPLESRGYKSLKKRIKEGELVALETDKSGKMTLITMEDYLKLGLKKAKEDKEIDFNEVVKIQNKINDTTRYWIKILNAGASTGQM